MSSEDFYRIQRLPPYTFNVVNDLKMKLRKAGEDIIDLGMGNPDLPTPPHIVEKLQMLSRGTLTRPVDWFDLFLHGAPWLLLLLKAVASGRR